MFASADAENLVFRFPADIDDHLRMLKKDANEVRQKWVTHDNWEYSLFLRLLTPIHDLDIKIPEEGDTDFEETVKIIMDFLAVIRIDDWGVQPRIVQLKIIFMCWPLHLRCGLDQ